MTTPVYTFIATKTTYATTIPAVVENLPELNRRVRGALLANAGGATRVGELAEFPLPSPPPENHLLCDGREVLKTDYRELFAYLGDSQGTASDPLRFKLPDYIGTKPVASTAPEQTLTTGGTVSTGGTVTTPTNPGQTGGSTGGNVPSGGRPRRPGDTVTDLP